MRIQVQVGRDQVLVVAGDQQVTVRGSFLPRLFSSSLLDEVGQLVGCVISDHIHQCQLESANTTAHHERRVLAFEVDDTTYSGLQLIMTPERQQQYDAYWADQQLIQDMAGSS